MAKLYFRVKKDGKEFIDSADGTLFEHNGVALHIRKDHTYYLISLHNSGLLTRGVGKTIREAVELYDINEGALINNWLYERGTDHLKMLRDMYIEDNTAQEIEKEYDPKTGRLVITKHVKAGDLI